MDLETAGTFFALLAIFCVVGTVALAVGRLVGAGAPIVAAIGSQRYLLAGLVALGATVGSLYLSESQGLIPCELCWYQRIAMYPLVVVLFVAAVRKSDTARITATVLAGIGLVISAYHVQLMAFPDQGSTCDVSVPCAVPWIDIFGFIHIPTMALAAFVTILGVLWVPPSTHEEMI